MQNFKKYAFYGFLAATVVGLSAVLGVVSVVLYQVYFGDVSELKKSTILARINEETTIYTADEEHKIGSFFNDSHRSYVPVQNIPAHMIRAMVASEDKNFYEHVGVDWVATFVAAAEGVSNGLKFRRGASTITQQTVKNILDRREHSFKRKFKEMIRAIQLERMYEKEQILEFYLNQFHVTANGKGIGIAAKYYFNKDVEDIDLVEAAFIAGSVKAPSKYNPFIKYTKESRDKALLEAMRRKNYVLRRMYEQGWIDRDELEEAWERTVPFKRGKFRTREVALVSLIRGQMNKKEVLKALGMESIQELNHAGLKIFTTIDHEMQTTGQLAMRRNLSRLESILKGYGTANEKSFRNLRSLEENQFYYGRVEEVIRGKNPKILVDFGLPKGEISTEALERTAKILTLPTYKGYEFHLKEILDSTKKGDTVFVEVSSYDSDSNFAQLELKTKPKINGGLIAVDKGEVKSVVAGFDNKGYNRAMFAARQPGSVFKSVVFFAGLQLGWNILDSLDNERRIFTMQGTYYFPRPDHKSIYRDVSLLWAGTKSENLATVYLTSRLLEKLNFEEFQALLGSMDLLPQEGELPRDYHYRVAKKTGVQLDNSGVREYLLGKVIKDLRPDLIFSGRQGLLRDLDKLWWGRGYLGELKNIYSASTKDISEKEKTIRIGLLKRNYERAGRLAAEMQVDWDLIADAVLANGPEMVFASEELREIISRFRVLTSTSMPSLAYIRDLPGEEMGDIDPAKAGNPNPPVPGRTLNPLDIQAIWGSADGLGGQSGISLGDVLLDAYLPYRYYQRLTQELEEKYAAVMGQQDKYSLYQYFHHHDYKTAVGLNYLVDLSRAMGVYSPLEPVLSFGLGTNEVSVAEVAKIYQVFKSGKSYRFFEEGPENQLNFVKRIEDRDGNILFEPRNEVHQLVDPCFSSQMSEVLRKVVTHGTGRRARGELYLDLAKIEDLSAEFKKRKIRIPAFGKTGTTNDYTTAYFAGYVPYPVKGGGLNVEENSYVIASYVGYDLNQTMRRGSFRISGAHGALPIWTDFAKQLLTVKDYGQYLDRFDLSMLSKQAWPLQVSECARKVKVDLPRGTIIRPGQAFDDEVFGFTNFNQDGETYLNEFSRTRSVNSYVHLAMRRDEGTVRPRRLFQPFHNLAKKQEQLKDVSGDDRETPKNAALPAENDKQESVDYDDEEISDVENGLGAETEESTFPEMNDTVSRTAGQDE